MIAIEKMMLAITIWNETNRIRSGSVFSASTPLMFENRNAVSTRPKKPTSRMLMTSEASLFSSYSSKKMPLKTNPARIPAKFA